MINFGVLAVMIFCIIMMKIVKNISG